MTISTVEIAAKFSKEHKHVLRDVKSIMRRKSEWADLLEETTYRDSYGRRKPLFRLSGHLKEFLFLKYENRLHGASLEKAFSQWLEELFNPDFIVSQQKVGKYRIDFVIGELVFIEYDEKEHDYKRIKDLNRLDEIKSILTNELNQDEASDQAFSIVRVKEGKEIEGVRKILVELDRLSNGNLSIYLNKEAKR